MRIAINTLSIRPNKIGGGQTYLVNLVKNLCKVDNVNEYYLFVSPFNRNIFDDIKKSNLKKIICPFFIADNVPFRIVYEQITISYLIRKYKIDVLHSPGNYMPLSNNTRNIITIQSTIPYCYPELVPFGKRALLNYFTKISCKKSKKIISVSNYSKEQICSVLKIPYKKVRTVYHGIDRDFFKRLDKNWAKKEAEKRFGIRDKFILSMSTVNPQKNQRGTIESFGYIKSKYSCDDIKLLQVGLKSQEHAKLLEEIQKNGLKDDILILGYVDFENMPILYNVAELLLFPSLGEGFGLPLLEAMACGCPVVTSNTCGIPEVVGEAALKVDPFNFREIGEAVYTLLKDKELRERLIKKGLKRIEMFTWEKTAIETLRVYEAAHRSHFLTRGGAV